MQLEEERKIEVDDDDSDNDQYVDPELQEMVNSPDYQEPEVGHEPEKLIDRSKSLSLSWFKS